MPLCWFPVIIYSLILQYNTLLDHPKLDLFGMELTLNVWAMPLIFLAGCATWPFLEYFLHRFLFHLEPMSGNEFLIRLHFTMHGQHHKAPFDPYHLVFPPAPAALIAITIYSIFSLFLPACIMKGWFAGTALGYVTYDLIHYYLHHGHPEPNSYFGRLKKWHIRHHYIDYNNGFGVSSNVLDFPFGTDFPNYKCD